MQPTVIYRVPLLAAVFLSTVPVFAATNTSSSGLSVIGPVADLNIVNTVISPDGFSRSAVLAGGAFPGPLIAANKGDGFQINIVNQLNDTSMDTNTSVHWHGIHQVGSSWADGTTGATQCPVKPKNSFLHQFNPQTQTGTYWYHSHYSLQYCDGLRGPLVIYDPNDPHQGMYDVDNASTVIFLSDWYHNPTPVLAAPFNADSTLINGLGRYSGGPQSPLAVINVEQGKRYRFRIVGASCSPSFNFTIDGHPMTVIETDGIETVPLVVDSIAVFPGQRYSVVVTANQTVGNYWIRALSSQAGSTFNGGQNSAILRYGGAADADPTTQHGPYVLTYNEANAQPLASLSPGAPGVPEPGKADVNINLVPGFNGVNFTINNFAFATPSVPVLLQILNGARNAAQLLPNGSVYELPIGKVIEISMPATDTQAGGAIGAPHSLHLHGHSFDVIRVPGSSIYNFANPVRRDVISTGLEANNDNVTIRFTTDNPGPWFLHCHINFHLHSGFAVVMAEAPDLTATLPVPSNSVINAYGRWSDPACPNHSQHRDC